MAYKKQSREIPIMIKIVQVKRDGSKVIYGQASNTYKRSTGTSRIVQGLFFRSL